MKGHRQNGKYSIMAEINMIPFIDVALVLLIIFMVITPELVKSQILIKLPTLQKGDAAQANEAPVRVQVNKEGEVFVGGSRVRSDAVDSSLAAALFNPKSQSLLIEADKDTSFRNVVKIMGAAKKLGVSKMAVGVMEEKKSKRRFPSL